jgi:hypothetical protein
MSLYLSGWSVSFMQEHLPIAWSTITLTQSGLSNRDIPDWTIIRLNSKENPRREIFTNKTLYISW